MTWFVMRDLTRANSKTSAYTLLQEAGFSVYTPLTWRLRERGGRKMREQVPVIRDLLFVDSTREELDPFVESLPTLQYRYRRGGQYRESLTVRDADMRRFITATCEAPDPIFFSPGEISASMVGRKVEIIGGPLHGFQGNLLSVKGMRKKRLIVEIPDMISAAVEVAPEFIRFV